MWIHDGRGSREEGEPCLVGWVRGQEHPAWLVVCVCVQQAVRIVSVCAASVHDGVSGGYVPTPYPQAAVTASSMGQHSLVQSWKQTHDIRL